MMFSCLPSVAFSAAAGLAWYLVAAGVLVLVAAGLVFLLAGRPRHIAGTVPSRMPELRRQVLRLGRLVRSMPKGISFHS